MNRRRLQLLQGNAPLTDDPLPKELAVSDLVKNEARPVLFISQINQLLNWANSHSLSWFCSKDLTGRLRKLKETKKIACAFLLANFNEKIGNQTRVSFHVFRASTICQQRVQTVEDLTKNEQECNSSNSIDVMIREPIPPTTFCSACSDQFSCYLSHISTVQHRSNSMTQNRDYYKRIDDVFSELRLKNAKSIAQGDVIGYYERRTQEM